MARRRRASSSRMLTLNKYKLGAFFIVLGGLYFFAFALAQGSPILSIFERAAFVVFGEVGTQPFFGLCILVGIIFMLRGDLIKTIFHQFVLSLFFLSAVFNFPLLDNPELPYEQFGGYFSRPLLRVLDSMFGGKATAIKSFVVVLLVLVVIWILYTYNFRLPSMTIRLQQDAAKPKATTPERSGSLLSLFGFGRSKTSANMLIKKEVVSKQQLPLERIAQTASTNKSQDTGSSLLKDIFKSSVTKKIDQKVHEHTAVKINFPADKPTFSPSLMPSSPSTNTVVDESFLIQNARALQDKLMEFNVPVTIDGFDIGPTVVQVRVRPEAGIKVSTIEGLQNDIALSMKTKSLRIISPIPGTDCVGIQIPNPKSRAVYLGDMLKSQDFAQSFQSNLTNLALGVSIDNTNIIKALDKMPHVLIAGATGSGKSVGVNGMILSLMYQNTPAELKFLMIDPKQVEMEFYSGLPYLLAPIVTRPDKALKILQWSVEEMESRYTKLKNAKAKKLEEYNAKNPDDMMYRIVIVIDELADLMMSGNKKDVENCITRIAQKARAVGMHLIVATQRPSVNVLTGLIKANIPTRVAFGVVSQIDSRTILGMKGAEDLVGRGDMLYLDTTTKYPIRMQSPFIDTPEIEKVIAALKDKYMKGINEEDIYHPEIVRILEGKAEVASAVFSDGGGSDEELIEQAIQVISQTGKASATMLQRKLNVGFARAARIMDALEDRGIVGPQDGAKPRDILI